MGISCLRKVTRSITPRLHRSTGWGWPRAGEKVEGTQQTTRTRGTPRAGGGDQGVPEPIWGPQLAHVHHSLLVVGRQDRKCTTSPHTSPKTPPTQTLRKGYMKMASSTV